MCSMKMKPDGDKKKKKSVPWAEEENLTQYFHFDLDRTERVNVCKIKAAKEKLIRNRQTFEMTSRHDTMEDTVPWTPPRPLTMVGSLVIPGHPSVPAGSKLPPVLANLNSGHSPQAQGSTLPPVLANINSGHSPQARGSTLPPVLQELLTSIIEVILLWILLWTIFEGARGTNQSVEDLMKRPDFLNKIKQLLVLIKKNQNPPANVPPMNPGLLGHGPGINNMNMQMPMNDHAPPPHGPPFNPGGPHMMRNVTFCSAV